MTGVVQRHLRVPRETEKSQIVRVARREIDYFVWLEKNDMEREDAWPYTGAAEHRVGMRHLRRSSQVTPENRWSSKLDQLVDGRDLTGESGKQTGSIVFLPRAASWVAKNAPFVLS
jgi:hypothetical protein